MNVGQAAPDFSLYTSEKTKISLSEFRGTPVLLLFFPLAFTSVCTAELCDVRDQMSLYNEAEVTVLGISVDSVYTLAKYKEDQRLNFQLLSDFNKEVSKKYNSLYEKFGFDMEGVSKRAAFLIDREGVIQYAEILDNAGEQPNFVALKDEMRKITK
ncbi:MAG TPA: redoxin domain-containing protein [Flavisolibacter sp.]|jgi:peroxiredoxin|nr:redoxin domain-containing protein [Flavisolibacter sp.]